jgi:hypothetical protein
MWSVHYGIPYEHVRKEKVEMQTAHEFACWNRENVVKRRSPCTSLEGVWGPGIIGVDRGEW